jgi:hypothetical protein
MPASNDPIQQLMESMKDAQSKVQQGAAPLKSALGAVGTAFSSLTKVASLAMGGIGAVTSAIGGLTGVLTAPIDMIQSLATAITGMVELVNPAIVQQFTFAMNDAMAVMGSMLVPVMQAMTIYMRAFGDSLARMQPILQPLFDALAQYLANSALMFGQLIEAMAPFIQLMVSGLVPVINEVSKAIAFAVGWMTELIRTISELLGLSSNFDKSRTAEGRAARNIKVGSVESFANDQFAMMVKNMFGGPDQGKKPEEHLADIKKAMEAGAEVIRKIAKIGDDIYKFLKEELGPLIARFKEAREDAKSFASGGGFLGMLLNKIGSLSLS